MIKPAIVLVLILIVASPVYAANIFDQLINKQVILDANHVTILVNRITGKVKYIKLNNGRWEVLKGGLKNKCQAMYDNQVSRRPDLTFISP
ncbi:MAG: hypothetical protein PHR73_04510 [Candidatus Omnitrophica bacterium]|nr:hypothetical protein [Candidatus Omnitrophota bacterium]